MTTLADVLELHALDLSVMPLGSPDVPIPKWKYKNNDRQEVEAGWPKKPIVGSWKHLQESPASEEQVEQWWQEYPSANVAILTGVEVNVVDADTPAAVKWCKENLTRTPWTVTTAKGTHFYYHADGAEVKCSAGRGIDIRGVGGYVVGPTSIHATGHTYTLNKDEGVSCDNYVDLPSLCTDDIDKIESFRSAASSNAPNDKDVLLDLSEHPGYDKPASEGERNNALTQYAGSLLGSGVGYEETLENCKRWNKTNERPLKNPELTKTVYSVYIKEKQKRESRGTPHLKTIEANDLPQWPELEPLEPKLEAAPCPIDSLPLVMRKAVKEFQGIVKSPIELVVQSAMSALAGACQARYKVERDSYGIFPVSLFTLTIAESGERKSASDGVFIKPILQFEKQQLEAYSKSKRVYEADHIAWEKKAKSQQGIVEKLSVDDTENVEGDDLDTAKEALVKTLEAEPRYPIRERIIFNDITPEALMQFLSIHPIALITSAEAGGVLASAGMRAESATNFVSKLNQMWEAQDISDDRVGRDSSDVRDPRVSLGLMVQPAVFDNFVAGDGHLAKSSGFLSRFLFAHPISTKGERAYREPPQVLEDVVAFCNVLSRIVNKGADIPPALRQSITLGLSEEAKDFWETYNNSIEKEVGDGGKYEDVSETACKSGQIAIRLGALFEIVSSSGEPDLVSQESMQCGCMWAYWYLQEALRCFGSSIRPQAIKDAQVIEQWLIKRQQSTGLLRTKKSLINKDGPSQLRGQRERIESALAELGECNRLRGIREGKTVLLEVHPQLLEVVL